MLSKFAFLVVAIVTSLFTATMTEDWLLLKTHHLRWVVPSLPHVIFLVPILPPVEIKSTLPWSPPLPHKFHCPAGPARRVDTTRKGRWTGRRSKQTIALAPVPGRRDSDVAHPPPRPDPISPLHQIILPRPWQGNLTARSHPSKARNKNKNHGD
ncbi:hypothetical protein QBC39DRAFT_169367 [Podospora conica]|nr:hypothetical protein QBC39DRAFT_169367 [Schizothecium conicum]